VTYRNHFCALLVLAAFAGCSSALPADGPDLDGGSDASAPGSGGDSGAAADANDSDVDAARPDGASDGGDGGDGGASGLSSGLPCGQLGNLDAASGVLIDLGHASAIVALQRSGDRLLSLDGVGHWVLWDTTARRILAQGTASTWLSLRPQLVADRLVIPSTTALTIRSAATGDVLGTVTTPVPQSTTQPAYGLSADAHYVWVATGTSLKLWTIDGTPVTTVNGDYSNAKVFATAGELRIGAGAAGANVIETIALGTGASTTSATFLGTFHSWFQDGASFFTNVTNTVRVYSLAISQRAIAALPEITALTGQGDVFWTLSTLDKPFAVGNVLAIARAADVSLDFIALDQPGMPSTRVAVPVAFVGAFTSDAAGRWVFGNTRGAVLEGADLAHPLSCGAANSISGADDGTAAIATEAGGILLFKLGASSRQYLGSIPFQSSHVELSSDGTTLAAAASSLDYQYVPDRTVKVFSLPSATLQKAWSSSFTESSPIRDFSLSSNGNRVGLVAGSGGSQPVYARQVFDLVHPDPTFSQTGSVEEPFRLSPNGTRVAAATGGNVDVNTSTNIFEDGKLIGAVPGYPVAWLDEDRILVNRYVKIKFDTAPLNAEVYDAQGVKQTIPTLPTLPPLRLIGSSALYTPYSTYSLTTGAKTWSAAKDACGARGSIQLGNAVYTPCEAQNAVVTEPR
jgi:hypothetical protein